MPVQKREKENKSPLGPPFSPPLFIQRAHKVLQLLQEYNCRSFIDAGCSRGDLLRLILASRLCERSFSNVVAIDLNEDALQEASRSAPPSVFLSPVAFLSPMRIEFIHGDLTKLPHLPQFIKYSDNQAGKNNEEMKNLLTYKPTLLTSSRFDAIISIEVLEHIHPNNVPAYTEVIFGHLKAMTDVRLVIITTPNRDRNVFNSIEKGDDKLFEKNNSDSFSNLKYSLPYAVRNEDHKFEMTATQFRQYCDYVLEVYRPKWVSYTLFGVGDNFTQGAVFHAGGSFAFHPCISNRVSSKVNFEYLKSVLTRKRDNEKQHKKLNSLLSSSFMTNGTQILNDSANRIRLFPWEAIFGDLSYHSEESILLPDKERFNYRCIASVEVPYLPLWKRLQNSVRETCHCAAKEAKQNSRSDYVLNFNDMVKEYKYLLFDPLHASLCAFINCLLKRERWYRNQTRREVHLLSHSSRNTVENIYFILYWLLHKCWGDDTLNRLLKDDTYGSTVNALSHDEARLVLFLTAIDVLPGAALHLSKVMRRDCWLVASLRRRGLNGKINTIISDDLPPAGVTASPENRLRMRRFTDALSEFQVPLYYFKN